MEKHNLAANILRCYNTFKKRTVAIFAGIFIIPFLLDTDKSSVLTITIIALSLNLRIAHMFNAVAIIVSLNLRIAHILNSVPIILSLNLCTARILNYVPLILTFNLRIAHIFNSISILVSFVFLPTVFIGHEVEVCPISSQQEHGRSGHVDLL